MRPSRKHRSSLGWVGQVLPDRGDVCRRRTCSVRRDERAHTLTQARARTHTVYATRPRAASTFIYSSVRYLPLPSVPLSCVFTFAPAVPTCLNKHINCSPPPRPISRTKRVATGGTAIGCEAENNPARLPIATEIATGNARTARTRKRISSRRTRSCSLLLT